MRTRQSLLSLILVLLAATAFSVAEESTEAKPQFGNPDCPVCSGAGIITPLTMRKKSTKNTKQTVMYCYYKAAGKRCNILIGGWEPCLNCSDLPTMMKVVRDHDACLGYYQEHADSYYKLDDTLGMKFNYGEGVHFRLVSDCDHSVFHGTIEALEKSWDIFAEEWGFLPKSYIAKQPICFEEPGGDFDGEGEDADAIGRGLMWDTQWRESQETVYLVSNKEEYLKFVDWYWHNAATNKGPDSLRIWKECAAIGIAGGLPSGRLTYWRDELETHCSLVHGAGHQYLSEVGCNNLPHWLYEGFAKYMEFRTKNATLTHCIQYGTGTKIDEDWKDSNSWQSKLKEAAGRESSFNENSRQWSGLIPMDIMMQYRIENISWQGMAQSWALVMYLMGEGQSAKVKRAYIDKFKELSRGLSNTAKDLVKQEEVFKEVYQTSSADVFEKWRAWLKKW